MKHKLLKFMPFLAIGLALMPSLVQAHVGVGQTTGLWQGFLHPLGGLDHILAMVGVGLWAKQNGGRAIWAIPLAFGGVMALGGILGAVGVALPFVETGVLASVLILGVLIAAAVRMPLAAASLLVGLFAVFHGHAHGAEMSVSAAGLAYGVGFVLTTALLHASGIVLGTLMSKDFGARAVRYAGAAIVLTGVSLFFA